MDNTLTKKYIWLVLFSIAMAFLESAVVVYLREIYYPDGFSFPLSPIDMKLGVTELLREAATLIMLLSVAIIAGRNNIEKFAFFIFSFGIWDIFYYVFLKALVSWPESLFTWDVLFLLPLTWTGPVLTPVINSLTMILITIMLVYFKNKNGTVHSFNPALWLFIAGSLFVLYAYMADYTGYLLKQYSLGEIISAFSNENLLQYAQHYIPVKFNWFVFIIGVMMHFAGIFLIIFKNIKTASNES